MHLFLDFDGVLHPVGAGPAQWFCQLPLLERFLREDAPHWAVVISSSWRDDHTMAELREVFSSDLRGRILGTTPADDAPGLHSTWGAQASLYPREIQIRHYLAQRGLSSSDWLALDDIGHGFRDARANPHLVLCNPATGLTPLELVQLRTRGGL